MLTGEPSLAGLLVVHQAPEGVGIENLHVPLLDFHGSILDEFRERAAYGFKLQPEVAADFFARHAQHQLAAGKAARVQALHDVQQEAGEALFGADARGEAFLTLPFLAYAGGLAAVATWAEQA